MIIEGITAHRNGCIREFEYDFGTKTIRNLSTGKAVQGSLESFEILKSDLKKQGFRFLPYNPDKVVMTPAQRQEFRNFFGY